MTDFFSRYRFWIFFLIVYLVTRTIHILGLPVFADEAIYIRWGQLLLEDPSRYAFFPLNDGKTPLFIWFLSGALSFGGDPLLAGRLLSGAIGLLQVGALVWFVRELSGSIRAQRIAAACVLVLPFWFFHHRMVMMDGLLTVFLTLFLAASISLQREVKAHHSKNGQLLAVARELLRKTSVLKMVLLSGFFLGLALLVKVPAILCVPAALPFLFAFPVTQRTEYVSRLLFFGMSICVGLLLFVLLSLHPSFAQLFSRGSDFLFSSSEFLSGSWIASLGNIPSYVQYFLFYLTPGVVFTSLFGLFLPQQRRRQLLLLLAFLFFCLPIALLGKVVYARYLLPAAIFMTASSAIALDGFISRIQDQGVLSARKLMLSVAISLLAAQILGVALLFQFYSFVDSDNTPFVASDSVQYLTEWSSGHGVRQAAEMIADVAETKRIAVATEGFFGTLPDGLIMYFFRNHGDSVYIDGIGQPVGDVPDWFLERAQDYDEAWLLVNSHRLRSPFPAEQLLAEFCRPHRGPCLQLWDIGPQVEIFAEK